MSAIQFITGKAALVNFLAGIKAEAIEQLDQRNINASGALKRSTNYAVNVDVGRVDASLFALSYWETAGSGSPPGTVANLTALKAWALDKGIIKGVADPSGFAQTVKDNILLWGSNDWIAGNENVYIRSVENAAPKVAPMLLAFARDYSTPIAAEFKKAFG